MPRRIEEELSYALGEGCMIHWLWLNGIGFGGMGLALVGGFIDSFVVICGLWVGVVRVLVFVLFVYYWYLYCFSVRAVMLSL